MSPPEPMTPPECDLRGLPFMPLDVVRLGDSDLFALSTGDEFKAAVALWCKAWLQVPAGSLPDDPRILAHLSGAGARWGKVKEVALRGWIKCSDGRLYHPVVSDKALDAWERRHDAGEARERHAEKMRKWRDARAKKLNGSGGGNSDGGVIVTTNDVTVTDTPRERSRAAIGNGHVPSLTGTVQGQGQNPPYSPPLAAEGATPQAARGKTRTQRTLLSREWEPTEAERGYASQHGVDPDATALDFRDYWVGHGKPMADWGLTWQRWCRTAESRQKAGRKPPEAREFRNGFAELARRQDGGEDVFGSLFQGDPDAACH